MSAISAPARPLTDYRRWYDEVFPELHHHGLWLRGGELNTLPRAEYDARAFRVLFARLSTYYDTGYSFTHQLLYQIAAGTPGVFPDLAYLPPRSDAALFRRDGVPWLLGTQTKRGAKDFDLVGISNSIVQELINLPHFLASSGIPLAKSERLARTDVPLVLLGGANALYTSAVWGADPLVDAVFVGESDAAIRRLLEICRDGKAAGLSKKELLARLEDIDGVIQPEAPRRTKKSFIPSLNRSEALERGPVYYLDEQLGTSHLQISEGCPCFCSFCAESWDRKPYRERRAPVLRDTALRAKAAMGLDQIEIYSFNFNMHSDFYQVMWDLAPHFRGIGLRSQRFDLLAHDPEMVEFQHAIEKASLTCGLEGISPRLRRYLHKNLEDGELHTSLTAIFRSRARALKVFLIATGLEEEQDFAAFADLVDHMREVRTQEGAGTRVMFSMTPLVRFPWTPLEFEDAFPTARYGKIIERAGTIARAAGFEFREAADLPEYWVSQVLVRAADPRIAAALTETALATGFVYYRDVPNFFRAALATALAERGLDEEALLRGYTLEEGATKPWTAVETGVKREFLWTEVERAREYREIDYCLGRKWTRAKCFHCGGCPTKEHVRDLVLAKQERKYTLAAFQERLRTAREGETEASFVVEVGEAGRGVPRRMVGVALARALMLVVPDLRLHYRGYSGSHWDHDEHPVWITGADRLTLRWDRAALAPLEQALADDDVRARIDQELGAWGALRSAGRDDAAWRPDALVLESPYPFRADGYLKSALLDFTLRRRPDTGGYDYMFSKNALRRRVLASLSTAERPGGGAIVTLTPGDKLDAERLVRESFVLPRPHDWVRTRARSVKMP